MRVSTEEITKHDARYCVHCRMKLGFVRFINAQDAFTIMCSDHVAFIGISDKRYCELERIWDDARVGILCCNCYQFINEKPGREEGIIDILMNEYESRKKILKKVDRDIKEINREIERKGD